MFLVKDEEVIEKSCVLLSRLLAQGRVQRRIINRTAICTHVYIASYKRQRGNKVYRTMFDFYSLVWVLLWHYRDVLLRRIHETFLLLFARKPLGDTFATSR